MRTLDDQLARLATLSPAELRGEWLQLFRTPAPAVGPRLLALAIAHRLQEKALGALAVEHARELARLAKRYGATGEIDTDANATLKARSEERRVGKECVSTGRSRWSPSHETKRRVTES